jgi:parallel beta-helix repeat protein
VTVTILLSSTIYGQSQDKFDSPVILWQDNNQTSTIANTVNVDMVQRGNSPELSSDALNPNNLYLPLDLSGLVIAFDRSHEPYSDSDLVWNVRHNTSLDLESHLTFYGAEFHTIEGSFSIPSSTNILLIPNSNMFYSTSELNAISTWFSSPGKKLLWIAGDADYLGFYSSDPNNEILNAVGANLRLAKDTVFDDVYNDGADYRVAVQTPVSGGNLNSVFTMGVNSSIMHGPTSVLGFQGGSIVDLNSTSIPNVEVVMQTSENATSVDHDLSSGTFDYYSSLGKIGNFPMMAVQNMTNDKYVIASGEAIFTDFREMYNIFTHQWYLGNPNVWNNGRHDGKTLVDNIFTWFGTTQTMPTRTYHGPVNIVNNDFNTSWNFPGNGTINDPFIIEGWTFLPSGAGNIEVRDSTDYFVIRNNNIIGGTFGIFLNNAANGIIHNNIVWNSTYGIDVHNSNAITIANNTVFDQHEAGIQLYNSVNTIIQDNIAFNNGWDGIRLILSNSNHIESNIAYRNNFEGIRLENWATGNTIISNWVFGNQENGIWLGMMSHTNDITDNYVYTNRWDGIWAGDESASNQIYFNEAHDNRNSGIGIFNASNNDIAFNTIYQNGGWGGISQDLSSNTGISNNTIFSNLANGIVLDRTDSAVISGNDISTSKFVGIRIGVDSSNNQFYQNDIYNNYEDGIRLTRFQYPDC